MKLTHMYFDLYADTYKRKWQLCSFLRSINMNTDYTEAGKLALTFFNKIS